MAGWCRNGVLRFQTCLFKNNATNLWVDLQYPRWWWPINVTVTSYILLVKLIENKIISFYLLQFKGLTNTGDGQIRDTCLMPWPTCSGEPESQIWSLNHHAQHWNHLRPGLPTGCAPWQSRLTLQMVDTKQMFWLKNKLFTASVSPPEAGQGSQIKVPYYRFEKHIMIHTRN